MAGWKKQLVSVRSAVVQAIRTGVLVRPEKCSDCGKTGRIYAHHEDYEKPLDVAWLCHACHTRIHRQKRNLHLPGESPAQSLRRRRREKGVCVTCGREPISTESRCECVGCTAVRRERARKRNMLKAWRPGTTGRIPIGRERQARARHQRIADAYAAGIPVAQIAKRFHCGCSTVLTLAKQLGTQMRPVGRPRKNP